MRRCPEPTQFTLPNPKVRRALALQEYPAKFVVIDPFNVSGVKVPEPFGGPPVADKVG